MTCFSLYFQTFQTVARYMGSREFKIPDGEARVELFDRVTTALGDIASRHVGESIVAVAHGGVINALWLRCTCDPANLPAVRTACRPPCRLCALRFALKNTFLPHVQPTRALLSRVAPHVAPRIQSHVVSCRASLYTLH
jgi:broad specificity phosphatase PhoE